MTQRLLFLLFIFLIAAGNLHAQTTERSTDAQTALARADLKPAFAQMGYATLADSINKLAWAKKREHNLTQDQARMVFQGADKLYKSIHGKKPYTEFLDFKSSFATENPADQQVFYILTGISLHITEPQR